MSLAYEKTTLIKRESQNLTADKLVQLLESIKFNDEETFEFFFNDNNIGDNGVKELAKFAKDKHITIKTLKIAGNNITPAAVPDLLEIIKQTGIKALDVSCNELNKANFMVLVDSSLSRLAVASNEIKMDDEVVEKVKGNKSLVDIAVNGNNFFRGDRKEVMDKIVSYINRNKNEAQNTVAVVKTSIEDEAKKEMNANNLNPKINNDTKASGFKM